jgi:GDP-fucose transporter C1
MFLGVTLGLLNKAVFEHTALPQAALTLIHLICTVLISWLYINVVHSFLPLFPDLYLKSLDSDSRRKMVYYSLLIVVNIVLGNGTIRYLSVPLAQVIRSLVPVTTAIVAFLVIREVLEWKKGLVLVVVVVGAMCSVYGDFDNWSGIGLFIAFLGCVMASLKGTLQKKFVSGGDFSFHPIDLIYKSSLYSIPICLIISLVTEYEEVKAALPTLTSSRWSSIWISGVFAGLLNISNIMATQATTAVAMAIAGNLRNALLIGFSIPLFATPITNLNAIGIVVTLFGSAVYSHLSIQTAAPPKFQLVDKPSEHLLGAISTRGEGDQASDDELEPVHSSKKSRDHAIDVDSDKVRATLIAHDMFSSDEDDDDELDGVRGVGSGGGGSSGVGRDGANGGAVGAGAGASNAASASV